METRAFSRPQRQTPSDRDQARGRNPRLHLNAIQDAEMRKKEGKVIALTDDSGRLVVPGGVVPPAEDAVGGGDDLAPHTEVAGEGAGPT